MDIYKWFLYQDKVYGNLQKRYFFLFQARTTLTERGGVRRRNLEFVYECFINSSLNEIQTNGFLTSIRPLLLSESAKMNTE